MIKSLITSLILTIILETMSSYILGIRSIKELRNIMFVNMYTNPIVVFLSNIIHLINNTLVYCFSILILEIATIIIEALLFKKYLKTDISSIRLSICNNFFSFGIGLFLLIIYKVYKGGIL